MSKNTWCKAVWIGVVSVTIWVAAAWLASTRGYVPVDDQRGSLQTENEPVQLPESTQTLDRDVTAPVTTHEKSWSDFGKRYKPPAASGLTGRAQKKIKADSALLERIVGPPAAFSVLTEWTILEFVGVTASPDYMFVDGKDAVAGIQKFLPGYRILYYDLGLTEQQRDQVKTWCNVELITFDFDKYPPHVRALETRAFQAIIISELLQTQKGVLWFDPWFRAYHGNWTIVFETILRSGGFYVFKQTGIPGIVTTHPKLYDYIPADTKKYRYVPDYWAGGLYIFNTEKIYRDIVYWWLLCSLDEKCIEPTKQYNCKIWPHAKWRNYVDRESPENTRWGKCHKYGHSVLSILANNAYGYESDKFAHPLQPYPVATVIRNNTWFHDLAYCTPE